VQTCHKLTEKSSKIVRLGAPSFSISLHWNELEKLAVTAAPLRKKQAILEGLQGHVVLSVFWKQCLATTMRWFAHAAWISNRGGSS